MRGYSWGNMYLSSIQQGIQGWHAQNELFNRYRPASDEIKTFQKWNKSHKTLILLNGGYQSHLAEIKRVLDKLATALRKSKLDQKLLGVLAIPVSSFHEESDALNGALTAVFTVLPETCYCTDPFERRDLLDAIKAAGFATPLEAADLGWRQFTLADRFRLVAMTGDMAK